MALQGTHRTYRQEEHPTDTETITYPEDLHEDHPNYDQRGETVEVPVIIEVEDTVYENCYVKIVSFSVEMLQDDHYHVYYNYWVYENEQQRLDNTWTFLYSNDVQGMYLTKDDICTNLFDVCYNNLKDIKGFYELTDA